MLVKSSIASLSPDLWFLPSCTLTHALQPAACTRVYLSWPLPLRRAASAQRPSLGQAVGQQPSDNFSAQLIWCGLSLYCLVVRMRTTQLTSLQLPTCRLPATTHRAPTPQLSMPHAVEPSLTLFCHHSCMSCPTLGDFPVGLVGLTITQHTIIHK